MQSQHIIAQSPIYTFFCLQYMPPCTRFEADIQEHKSPTETSQSCWEFSQVKEEKHNMHSRPETSRKENPFAKFLNAWQSKEKLEQPLVITTASEPGLHLWITWETRSLKTHQTKQVCLHLLALNTNGNNYITSRTTVKLWSQERLLLREAEGFPTSQHW